MEVEEVQNSGVQVILTQGVLNPAKLDAQSHYQEPWAGNGPVPYEPPVPRPHTTAYQVLGDWYIVMCPSPNGFRLNIHSGGMVPPLATSVNSVQGVEPKEE